MEYVIETENLTKKYETATVVDSVNLHVPKGKIYALLGRNGAGKTTVMKMMLQLVYPTNGTIQLVGISNEENIRTIYGKEERIESTGYPMILSVALILLVSVIGFYMTFYYFKKEDLK